MQLIKHIFNFLAVISLSAGEVTIPNEIFKQYNQIIGTKKINSNNHVVIMDLQEFPTRTGTIFVFHDDGSLKVFRVDGCKTTETMEINKNFVFELKDLRASLQAVIDPNKMMARVSALDADCFVYISKNHDNFMLFVMRENQIEFLKKLIEIENKIMINKSK